MQENNRARVLERGGVGWRVSVVLQLLATRGARTKRVGGLVTAQDDEDAHLLKYRTREEGERV